MFERLNRGDGVSRGIAIS